MAEYWDVLDGERNPVGRLHRRGVRLKNGDYHLICEAWLLTSDGKLLITQRHPDKNYGTLWECTGGAVTAGETSLQAIKREIREEIGLNALDSELEFVGSSKGATFFADFYIFRKDVTLEELTLQKEEVVNAKFVTLQEFLKMHKERRLIPHLYDYMKQCDFGFLKQNCFANK